MTVTDAGTLRLGRYPERRENAKTGKVPDSIPAFQLTKAGFASYRPRRFVREVRRLLSQSSLPDNVARQFDLAALGSALRGRDVDFAAVCEAAAVVARSVKHHLGFDVHDVQLLGAWHMLQGNLVEMETGEGKTLVAAFVAAIHGLAGRSVHVITTNDYLAERDADTMGPIYQSLGLSVGKVLDGMEDAARRHAYRSRIVYVTPKQVMFDYLRDGIKLGGKISSRLRSELTVQASRTLGTDTGGGFYLEGLQVAVVDEADSVFIDEAVVPLIISKQGGSPDIASVARTAIALAERLVEGEDFRCAPRGRDLWLTTEGETRLGEIAQTIGGVFGNAMWRQQYVLQALMALRLFQRDRDYIVRDDAVEIVDINTGRTMKDRSWERGLHQMIQAKEKLAVTAPNESVARTSHQKFFRHYLMVCGMSGTLTEVRSELKAVYGLNVVRIPTHHPSQRKALPTRVFGTIDGKLKRVAERAAMLSKEGRPVLIGTRTVADSERVSEALASFGVVHQVLNARHDADEAQVISQAGSFGTVTVATNMAGRGTDIKLAPGVEKIGGLHVLATERHESRRIDRQLFGRTARQGDPGSFEEILSLEDDLVQRFASAKIMRMFKMLRTSRLADYFIARAQKHAARRGHGLRLDLARYERQSAELLAFAGAGLNASENRQL